MIHKQMQPSKCQAMNLQAPTALTSRSFPAETLSSSSSSSSSSRRPPPTNHPPPHTPLTHIRFTRYLQYFRHVGTSYEA